MKKSEIIDELRKVCPYPADIFPYIKVNMWNFIFHRDRVMAYWGRWVWELCIIYLTNLFLKDI